MENTKIKRKLVSIQELLDLVSRKKTEGMNKHKVTWKVVVVQPYSTITRGWLKHKSLGHTHI